MSSRRRGLVWAMVILFAFCLIPPVPVQAADMQVTSIKNAYGFRDITGDCLVIIDGLGFGESGVGVQVTFEFSQVSKAVNKIVTWSDRQIAVRAPHYDLGNKDYEQVAAITIRDANGATLTYTSQKLVYIKNPAITNVYPYKEINVSGYDNEGVPIVESEVMWVAIEGTNLEKALRVTVATSGRSVFYSNQEEDRREPTYAGSIGWDNEGAICLAWNGIMENNDITFTIENTAGGLSEKYTAVQGDKQLSKIAIPEATSFNPSPSALIRGIDLVITGSNFKTESSKNTVIIAGGEAQVKSVTSIGLAKKLVAVVPDAAKSEQHNLHLKLRSDTDQVEAAAIYKGAINIIATPGQLEILGVLPNSGQPGGGYEVLIIGKGFNTDTEVVFATQEPEWQAVGTATQLLNQDEVPAGYPADAVALKTVVPRAPNRGLYTGPVDVTIRDKKLPALVKDTLTAGFFYSTQGQMLRLLNISPNSGPEEGGQNVTIVGKNIFRFRSADSRKFVNGQVIDVDLSHNPCEITNFPPNNIATTLREEIGDYYGYTGVVVDRTISLSLGGTPVKITGLTDFEQEDGQHIQYITGVTRAHYLDPLELNEVVDVVVKIVEGMYSNGERLIIADDPSLSEIGTLPQAYTYLRASSVPEILSITPKRGPTAGGTEVTITGYNFYDGLEVFFGETRATVLNITPQGFENGKQKVTAVVHTPAHSVREKVDVRVVNWDEGEAVLGKAFEYISSPRVAEVQPAVAPTDGGVFITIEGTEFLYGAAVKIGANIVTGRVFEDEDQNRRFYTELVQSLFPEESITFFPALELRVLKNDTELKAYDKEMGNRIILEVPPGILKQQPLTVINPDGGMTTWSKPFQYLEYKDELTPRINHITPNEGDIQGGNTVTITGNNFRSGVLVTIDGKLATEIVVSQAGQQLTCITPPGTRSEVWVPVQVINVTDTSIGMVTVGEGFRYHTIYTQPVITNFLPTHGTLGTKVFLYGAEFVVSPDTKVFMGESQLHTATSWTAEEQVAGAAFVKSPGQIELIVPNLPAPGKYRFRVINPDTSVAESTGEFNFQVPVSRPQIQDIDGDGKAISPERGSISGGTDLIVEGYDFHQGLELYVGGLPARDLQVQLLEFDSDTGVWTRCLIRAKTPALPEGQAPEAVDIMVVNPDGGTARLVGAFNYVAPASHPVVTRVEPGKGPAVGNQEVLLTGSDFRVTRDDANRIIAWPTVTFSGYEAVIIKDNTLTESQGTRLKVRTPTYPGGGAVNVTVTNPDTGTFTLDKGFTFEASKPAITAVIPPKFPKARASFATIIGTDFFLPTQEEGNIRAGSDVLISDASGKVFTSLKGTTTIEGQTYENIRVISPNQIKVVIPPLGLEERAGTRVLRVKNPDGAQADYTVEYVSPVVEPTISSVDPAQGSAKGGTNVTITGTNFREQIEVYFGVKKATVIEKSSTRLVVRTPSYVLPDQESAAAVDVVVINTADYGSAVKLDGFTYVKGESELFITAVNPDQGSTLGGTKVTITGDNFRPGCRVFFGAAEAASVVYDSYNRLLVVTPPYAKGSVDVSVRNPGPDYSEAIKTNGFTFIETVAPAPTDFDGKLWNKRAIKLFWTPAEVASRYEIFVSTSASESSRKYLGSTSNSEYMFEDIEAGYRYYFWMRTINQHGTSGFIACKSNPIYVSSDDITQRPPTASIDEGNTHITRVGDELRIIVGEDIITWPYSYYDISLDAAQRSARGVEVMIPGRAIEKNSGTTIRLAANHFSMELPLRAFATFEFDNFRRQSPQAYVRVYLHPAAPGHLESLALNRPGSKLAGGFVLESGLQADTRRASINLLVSNISVTWPGGKLPLGRSQAYYYDRNSLRWISATNATDSLSGMVNVRVSQPDVYVLFSE